MHSLTPDLAVDADIVADLQQLTSSIHAAHQQRSQLPDGLTEAPKLLTDPLYDDLHKVVHALQAVETALSAAGCLNRPGEPVSG